MHVLVHGGAGETPAEPVERQAVLETAATAGSETTTLDGAPATPLDAVEAAIRVLESDPRFNAGVGGAVQSDGTPRTDAGCMGSDGSAGAVCSLEGVSHPIAAARVVLEETPHVLVAGRHAVDLAAAFGVETDVDTWSERSRDRWGSAGPHPTDDLRAHLEWVGERFEGSDTVGAVATDRERLAAATSTGGRWFALAGRVGDVPQVGSGFFATERAAASATGDGEAIAKTNLTRRAVEAVEAGAATQTAAERAIEALAEETGSFAGVIVLDRAGNRGTATNAEAMQTAGEES